MLIVACSNAISMDMPAKQEHQQAAQLKQSNLDIFPQNVQIRILQLVTGNIEMGNTLSQAIADAKRFYIACPKSRENVDIMKAILSGLYFESGRELQYVCDKLGDLENFPALKNASMQEWVKQKKQQIDDECELLDAAFQLDVKRVEASIAKGININVVDNCGRTPLFCALIRGNYPARNHDLNKLSEVVPVLLNAGADTNARAQFGGSTILGLLSCGGHPLLMQMLLKAGADPNLAENAGDTSLTWAVFRLTREDVLDKSNHMKVVKLLLDAGASPNARGENGSIKEIIENGPGLTKEQKNELMELLRTYGLNES